jgi:hypothetical protein
MLQAHVTPALAAAQLLPERYQQRLDRAIERMARHNPRLRDQLDAAKSQRKADDDFRDDWLIQQHEERQLWADVPF